MHTLRLKVLTVCPIGQCAAVELVTSSLVARGWGSWLCDVPKGEVVVETEQRVGDWFGLDCVVGEVVDCVVERI